MDQIGPYRLDGLVGRGTAGSVWRATRTGPVPQVVAVKRARAATGDEGRDRLRHEAAVLADLDHPHIVRIFDVLDDGADVAIVMSYARGGSLHDLLAERGRLSPGQTVAVLSRIADALGSAHRHGVLHGDVKPANVLFTTDGEPLLGDFGVAQNLLPGATGLPGPGRPETGIDGAGGLRAIEGTAGYVDPALVETGRPEPRNDLYSLAVVAYLCLTGRLAHAGTEASDVLAAADAGEHPSLLDDASIPVALAEVVESGLARDPGQRPATAEELAQRLRGSVPAESMALPGTALAASDSIVDHEPVDDHLDRSADVELEGAAAEAPPSRGTRVFGPRPPVTEDQPRRGRPLLTGAVVVALIVAAVVGGLWARDRLDDSQDPTKVAIDGRPASGAECPDLEPIEVPPGAEETTADFNGDGCPVQVVWDGTVMRFRLKESDRRPRRFEFESAQRGSGQLLIGDWDCDGTESPAYYQPATGSVAYFPYVPERERAEVEATIDESGVTDGRAQVVDGTDGGDDCDTVEVSAEA